jgi:hypothetical protein
MIIFYINKVIGIYNKLLKIYKLLSLILPSLSKYKRWQKISFIKRKKIKRGGTKLMNYKKIGIWEGLKIWKKG